MKQATYMEKPENVERNWYIVDAADQVLGRIASETAHILKGKHKPTYTPHVDMGDYVVVINAEKVKLTGKKLDKKMHYKYSGYPGGIKAISYRKFMQKSPEKVVMHAVKGMLPKNKLGRKMLKRLRVFRGEEHSHQAQQPQELKFD